jgi:hypothetical protein
MPDFFLVQGRDWWIHTNDVEIITHVLKNIETYGLLLPSLPLPLFSLFTRSKGKGPIFKLHFGELLGEGVFSSGKSLLAIGRSLESQAIDGEPWYKHRKTSSHLFNLNVFKNGVLDTCSSPASPCLSSDLPSL